MRILYVEDNEVNRALVERVMRARQCSVVFQDEGEGALEALATDPTIDLILLDIELAGTMTGLDVIESLRARDDHRPVVAVTAYAMMGDRERILEAGCDQYLPKPLVVTDLLNMIDRYQDELAAKAVSQPGEAATPASGSAAPAAQTPAAESPASLPPSETAPVQVADAKPAETRPDAAQADQPPAVKADKPAAPSSSVAGTAANTVTTGAPASANAPTPVLTPPPGVTQTTDQELPVEDKRSP